MKMKKMRKFLALAIVGIMTLGATPVAAMADMVKIVPAGATAKDTSAHTITLYDEAKPKGGTYSADKTEAKAGETVTITATPDDGFYLLSITYSYWDDEENFNYDFYDEFADNTTTNTMTFTMPAHNVLVSAVFKNKEMKYVDEFELIIDGSEVLSFLEKGIYYHSASNSSEGYPFSISDEHNTTEPLTYQFFIKATEEHVAEGYLEKECYEERNSDGWVYADCYINGYELNDKAEYALSILVATDGVNYEFVENKEDLTITCDNFNISNYTIEAPEIVEVFVELGTVYDFAMTYIDYIKSDIIWSKLPFPEDVEEDSYLFYTDDTFVIAPDEGIYDTGFASWGVLSDDGAWVLYDENVKDTDIIGLGVVLWSDDGYVFTEETIKYITSADGEIFDAEGDEVAGVSPTMSFIISLGTKADVYKKLNEAEPVLVLTIDQTGYQLDGANLVNDVAPIIRNDRTMLPIRLVAETLGATVEWNDSEKSVTIVKDDVNIVIYIGSDSAVVNGSPVQLDAPAFIASDRTYLPVRFISESLGATVNWDAVTRQVTISVA